MHLHGSILFGNRAFATEANRFAYEDGWNDVYMHSDPIVEPDAG